MIQVQPHEEGCVIGVRAQPGARRNAIVGLHGGLLKIAVTAPPDKGRANEALADFLATALGLKRSQVELAGGPTSREKKFLLRGLNTAETISRIEIVLSGTT